MRPEACNKVLPVGMLPIRCLRIDKLVCFVYVKLKVVRLVEHVYGYLLRGLGAALLPLNLQKDR